MDMIAAMIRDAFAKDPLFAGLDDGTFDDVRVELVTTSPDAADLPAMVAQLRDCVVELRGTVALLDAAAAHHGSSPQTIVEGGPQFIDTAEVLRRLDIDRGTLDAMIDGRPRTLVGAPIPVGKGKQRRHYRWDAHKLDAWVAAVRDWRSHRGKRRR